MKKKLEDYGIRVIDCAAGSTELPNMSSISINQSTGSRTIWSGQQVFPLHLDFVAERDDGEDRLAFRSTGSESIQQDAKQSLMLNAQSGAMQDMQDTQKTQLGSRQDIQEHAFPNQLDTQQENTQRENPQQENQQNRSRRMEQELAQEQGIEQMLGQVQDLAQELQEAISQADFCLFDSNAPEIAVSLCQLAHQFHKPVVFDMGSWKPDSDLFLSLATEVIASSACIPPPDYGSFMETALDHNIHYVAITNGEGPIRWKENGQTGDIVPPVTVGADTLGAGDVYHGAYVYYRYKLGFTFTEALKKAAEVAAKSVAYAGPRDGVKAYLKISQ